MTLDTRNAERQVPFDERAEQQVLGSLLIDRDAIFKVADLLQVDDFYIPRHQRIYDAARRAQSQRAADNAMLGELRRTLDLLAR